MDNNKSGVTTPSISLPSGGGSISGMGETYQPNLFTGTGNFNVPIALSPGRDGFGPKLVLQYSTGNGNGLFGLGWNLNIPRITRKTEKGLPRYDSQDTFVLSGAEDLVVCNEQAGPDEYPDDYKVTRYLPRTEGLFARVECWEKIKGIDTGDVFWRVTTRENVTSFYGRTADARIVGPQAEVFEWLLQESCDAKGNHILYEYAIDNHAIDLLEIYEHNHDYRQKYLRRIFYGNLPDPFLNSPPFISRQAVARADPLKPRDRAYAFEVIFDYGDQRVPDEEFPYYNYTSPSQGGSQEVFGITNGNPATGTQIPVRADRFSSFRPGFELRTMRRCERVLMIHHFPELGGSTLVKSTNFSYKNDPNTKISILGSVSVTGYRKDSDHYVCTSMPPVTFKYSEFLPQHQKYEPVKASGNQFPQLSLSDPNTTLVDMFGNGLPDVVQTTTAGFRYWRNLGGGSLDQPRFLNNSPAGIMLERDGVAIADAGGDGMADLIIHNRDVAGFFEMSPDNGWSRDSFRHYHNIPGINLSDPNLRMLDLTGDGCSDLLLTMDKYFVWYESRGEEGFEAPRYIPREHDKDQFPNVFFSDPAQRVRLADMSGDGLNDIVLLINGGIQYWPNLGYGRFGRRIIMENSPLLPVNFNPSRLFLADLDGSGTADLVYVEFSEVKFWFNQSGNTWSETHAIKGTPATTNITSLAFTDFYGNGTTCLVWSYDSGSYPGSNYKVLDFCGGDKPYLLTEMNNNMGSTTRVSYASSTKFYLEDLNNGMPWVTALPFPVQVLEKSEVIDHISKTKLVTRYKYHHGYFDGREREFRGFGRVDQIDTESFEVFSQPGLHENGIEFTNNNKAFHIPSVETRNWFHTGAYFDENSLIRKYESEYWSGDGDAFELDDHDFVLHTPDLISNVEAHRILRGVLLRTEVFARDGSDRQGIPFTVSDYRYRIIEKQAPVLNLHGVYLEVPHETIKYNYERNPDDPGISHSITLKVDKFGNPISTLFIAYPRREDQREDLTKDIQGLSLIFLTENSYTTPIDNFADYRHSDGVYEKKYELTGLQREDDLPFKFTDINLILQNPGTVNELAFEDKPVPGLVQRRLINHKATIYWNENITAPMKSGENAGHGLPYETYQLALTPGLRTALFNDRVTTETAREAGYRQFNPATGLWKPAAMLDWWIPSGRQVFEPDSFLELKEIIDPFGNITTVTIDQYALLTESVTDSIGNRTQVIKQNYRLLKPQKISDTNENESEVLFDALGFVVATAVLAEGDNLQGLDPEPSQTEINNLPDNAQALLGNATTRNIYDFRRVEDGSDGPNFIHSLARETHVNQLIPGETLNIKQNRAYSDAYGREIQSKTITEPSSGQLQWLVSGWKRFNNKGNPVQEFEPYSTTSLDYQHETREGFSSTKFYDPLQRLVVTIYPNHTYSKTIFDAWRQELWDVNDTVLDYPHQDPVAGTYVGEFILQFDASEQFPAVFAGQYQSSFGNNYVNWYEQRVPPASATPEPMAGDRSWTGQPWDEFRAEKDAAVKTAGHAGTPSTVYLDPLGRSFLVKAHNRSDDLEDFFYTKTELDIEGNTVNVTDPRQYEKNNSRAVNNRVHNIVNGFDIAGRKLSINSIDAGLKQIFPDVAGKIVYRWEEPEQQLRMEYDVLQRPKRTWLKEENKPERLIQKTIYGEEAALPAPQVNNLRGKIYKIYDESGITTNICYDNKGNLGRSVREIIDDYKLVVDWNTTTLPAIADRFEIENSFDALNRPVTCIAPDKSRYMNSYNAAGLLKTTTIQFWDHVSGQLETSTTQFIKSIIYNAKGQRTAVHYGNNVITTYEYEPDTSRLQRISSYKGSSRLQDLHYVYDPAGNIIQTHDYAFTPVFNHNTRVNPANIYTYDALYRLIESRGREHEAMGAHHHLGSGKKCTEHFQLHSQAVHNGNALLNYIQSYKYDRAGNITRIRHQRPQHPPHIQSGWNRIQSYAETSNHILTSKAGSMLENNLNFTHDGRGNPVNMPHLEVMDWNYANQLSHVKTSAVTNGINDETYYSYDYKGQRTRKVVERNGQKAEERIYMGEFEIFRKFTGDDISFERQSLHVTDDKNRIALIETRSIDNGNSETGAIRRIRYQLANNLNSSTLEVDENARRILYEEYYPYGGTSYIASDNLIDADFRRYRYCGKERDEETGLYYFGVRYYAPWMGRWLSCDPKITAYPGVSPYHFSLNNPVVFTDPEGADARLSVDPVSNTITYKATVHLYVTDPRDLDAVRETANKAEAFYENPRIADQRSVVRKQKGKNVKEVTPTYFDDDTGKTWTVEFNVDYVVHKGAAPRTYGEDMNEDDYLGDPTTLRLHGVKPGDNVISILRPGSAPPGTPVGEVIGVKISEGDAETRERSVGKIIKSGDLLKRLVHETGHLLGFDERRFGAFSDHPGFRHDPMSTEKESTNKNDRELALHPIHIEEAALLGLAISGGEEVSDLDLNYVPIDDTKGGKLMSGSAEYNARQTRNRATQLDRLGIDPESRKKSEGLHYRARGCRLY